MRAARCDVILDQIYVEDHPGGPDGQWPAWTEAQIPNADKVLMIASDGYLRCYEQTEAPGMGLDAACETTIIRNELYHCGYVSNKFRIVYFDKTDLATLPEPLNGRRLLWQTDLYPSTLGFLRPTNATGKVAFKNAIRDFDFLKVESSRTRIEDSNSR